MLQHMMKHDSELPPSLFHAAGHASVWCIGLVGNRRPWHGRGLGKLPAIPQGCRDGIYRQLYPLGDPGVILTGSVALE